MFKEEAGFASSRECYRYTPRSKNKRKSYRRVILNEGVEIEEEGGSRPKNRSNLQCEPSPLLLPQRGIRQIFSICHGSIKSILRNDVGNGRYRVTLLISLLRRDRHRSGRGQFKRRAGRSPKNTPHVTIFRPGLVVSNAVLSFSVDVSHEIIGEGVGKKIRKTEFFPRRKRFDRGIKGGQKTRGKRNNFQFIPTERLECNVTRTIVSSKL